MTPFLKWVGGKRWLVSRHKNWLRNDATRYIEPFLGSGAVFFHLHPKAAIISDLNSELVNTYIALRDFPREVNRHLAAHHKAHNRDHYYMVRGQKLRSPASKAAQFIYLNRTCFNGIYRVNLNGVFNVPKGTKDAVLLTTDDFEEVSCRLKLAKIIACDFADTIRQSRENDFLYIDPPYTVRHNNNNFLKYNEHIFSWSDQKRLAKSLSKAAKQGASILLSNANHSCIHELYSAPCWNRITVTRFSRLASHSKHRKNTTEVVITNYLNEKGEKVGPRY